MRLSVILPVINETFSLQQTVGMLLAENNDDIFEIIVVISDKKTSRESKEVIEKLKSAHPLIKVLAQKLPFLGGAMRDAFDAVTGDYVLMMASDLETDPRTVKEMINKAKEGGYDIVATTRWKKSSGKFAGYNPLKLVFNKIFQSVFKFFYRTSLTDLTFGFRLYKTEIVKRIKWEELRHPFLFESIIKPLRLGYSAVEVPTAWSARQEGKSQNTFWQNFKYFIPGIKVLFTPKSELLK